MNNKKIIYFFTATAIACKVTFQQNILRVDPGDLPVIPIAALVSTHRSLFVFKVLCRNF